MGSATHRERKSSRHRLAMERYFRGKSVPRLRHREAAEKRCSPWFDTLTMRSRFDTLTMRSKPLKPFCLILSLSKDAV